MDVNVKVVSSPQTRPKYDPPVTRPRSPAVTRGASPTGRSLQLSQSAGEFSNSASVRARSISTAESPKLQQVGPRGGGAPSPSTQVNGSADPSRALFAATADSDVTTMSSLDAAKVVVKPPTTVEVLQLRLGQLEEEARLVAKQLQEEEAKNALAARVAELERALVIARERESSSNDLRRRLDVLESALSLTVQPHFPVNLSTAAAFGPAATSSARSPRYYSREDQQYSQQSMPFREMSPHRTPPAIFTSLSPTSNLRSSPPFATTHLPLEDYCAKVAIYASNVLPGKQ